MPLLVAWTVVLWLSRIRNVLTDDGLSRAGEIWRIVVAVTFISLAGAVLWTWMARAEHRSRADTLLRVLCGWTVLFWIGRGGGILVDDHPVGFKLIHTALMAISIGLAFWSWPRQRLPVRSANDAV